MKLHVVRRASQARRLNNRSVSRACQAQIEMSASHSAGPAPWMVRRWTVGRPAATTTPAAGRTGQRRCATRAVGGPMYGRPGRFFGPASFLSNSLGRRHLRRCSPLTLPPRSPGQAGGSSFTSRSLPRLRAGSDHPHQRHRNATALQPIVRAGIRLHLRPVPLQNSRHHFQHVTLSPTHFNSIFLHPSFSTSTGHYYLPMTTAK